MKFLFLAHLSLKAHWWAYSIDRPLSSVCMCVCVLHVNIFKHLLLWNHWADWSQISYGASLGLGNESLFKKVQVTWPRWPPCLYMVKTLKNLILRNQKADDLETCYAALAARVLPILFKWWLWVDLDLFYGKVKLGPLCFCMGKRKNNRFFRNYCHLWFENSIRWSKWQEVSVDVKTLSLGGCMPTAPGLYACIKSWKRSIKSDFKEISLKLATNG